KIRELDLKAFAFVQKKDPAGFFKFIDKTGATICGRSGIALLTAMLPENSEAHLLKYGTSAEIAGSGGDSVSYLAAAVTGKWEAMKNRKLVSLKILTPETRRNLLQLARKTIEFYLKEQRVPDVKELGISITPDMNKPLGAFVTLRKKGNLRGCIGNYPRQGVPLYKVVGMMAKAAAFNDHRFSPLEKNELKDVDIEISVLTPPKAVKSWKDIVIDRDGIILRKGWSAAVFLPQVAPEQDWTLEETLSYLARKAGLSWNGWREGAKFEVFQADVFGEK
ncbi:MAG: AmmeMemoRadiSam system protein A, partial [Victivallales bacterium]